MNFERSPKGETKQRIAHGLEPLKADRRDKKYLFHRNFGAVSPLTLPESYSCDAGLTMPDQEEDQAFTECTGYTTTDLATDEDGIEYSPDYTFAQTLRLMGVEPDWQGADQRTALKSAIAYGLLAKADAPYSAKEKGQTFIADHLIWNVYVDRALKNAKAAYYGVATGPYDAFDNIRNALWLNREKRMGVSIGTPWYPQWNTVGPDGIAPPPLAFADAFSNSYAATLPWHNWAIKGWKTINGQTYLIGKVWQGADFGDKGWVYFDRDTINRVLALAGTGAFTIAEEGNRLVFLLGLLTFDFPALLKFLPSLVKWLSTERTDSVPPATLPPATPLPSQPEPQFKWDNPSAARLSVRQISDEEGLNFEQKNSMTATIAAESGFITTAVNYNKVDGKVVSTDFGICQWNDYYHGQEISPDEAIKNPEKAVRLMCAYWKRGQRDLWIGYKSGAYKKFL